MLCSLRVGETTHALVPPPSSFLSIIETIIVRIPLPFKPDKPRLAAGEKENTRQPTGQNFFNLPSLCVSLVRVGSPPVNYSPP